MYTFPLGDHLQSHGSKFHLYGIISSLEVSSELQTQLSIYHLLFNAYQTFRTKQDWKRTLGFHPLRPIPHVFPISGDGITIFPVVEVLEVKLDSCLFLPPIQSVSKAWELCFSISPGPASSHHSPLHCPSPSHPFPDSLLPLLPSYSPLHTVDRGSFLKQTNSSHSPVVVRAQVGQ